MTQLELGDVRAVLVGEKARVPVAVLVEDLELSTGVRALAAADQPASLGPRRQIIRSVNSATERRPGQPRRRRSLAPTLFRDLEDRRADRLRQLVANREPDLSVAAVRRERVRLTTNIRAHEDLAVNVLHRQLREREPEHGEVILCRVRPGVPGSQDRGERLAGLVQPTAERVEPVPVLVVAGRQLLLRMRGQQRRVDVQRDRLRPRARAPDPRSRRSARRPNPPEQRLVDRLQHPMVVVSDALAPNSRS